MNNIKDLPVNDRPYEKCFAKGPEYLTDVELLAVILRTGHDLHSAHARVSVHLTYPKIFCHTNLKMVNRICCQ